MNINRRLLKESFISGLGKGWRGFIWILKILLPISFLTALLAWSGLIQRFDFLIQPVMGQLQLPGLAALPLLIGMTAGIYAGIAAMVVLPFTQAQMTLMAIFMMTAHNLIQEGVIQAKSGFHPLKAIPFRLAAATLTVMAVAPLIQSTAMPAGTTGGFAASSPPFISMLLNWGTSTFYLALRIFLIIMSILSLLEIFKALGWINPIVRVLAPFLRLLGLGPRVATLWITAAAFGLVYGSAVIVQEVKEGHLTKKEVEGVQLSIGVHHSIIEDPLLFVAIGLNAFWLWIPRLIMAMIVVRMFSFWQQLRQKISAGQGRS